MTATDVPAARTRGRTDWATWPKYDAAATGFRNYWYPVMWSSQLRDKPVAQTVCGERIMLLRDGGTAYALHDRCPHRGVPLSYGTQEFPGTISCPYHGWTFDLASGDLKAAITDGPDSAICGKVRVHAYPVAERLGLVWVFVGDGTPPPVEADIPAELTSNDLVLGGKVAVRSGNWRFAAENGFDEGHGKYLHRTALYRAFTQMPAWTKTHVTRLGPEEGDWIVRVQDETHWESDYPGLGRWPRRPWWQRRHMELTPTKFREVDPVIAGLKAPGFVSIRLPGTLRVIYEHLVHYEWYVPVDADHHRYVMFTVRFDTGLGGWLYKLRYWTYIRWLFHGQFTGQDQWMVDVTDAPPEQLYRPDVSLTAWRKLCEDRLRPQGADYRGEAEPVR
jgi:nitrite reductase/ring-hydroxylating ferredoxin subunit